MFQRYKNSSNNCCFEMKLPRHTWSKVTSEIHEKSDVDTSAKPHVSPKNIITNFVFKVPPFLSWITGNLNGLRVDEDGDLLVRRRNMPAQDAVIAIEQSHSTTLQFVGLQVWRGALVLADFMLHNGLSLIKDQTVLELGSGTGLSSIVAAMFAEEVICTDVDIGTILELIKANFARNNKYIKAKYSVLGLDFYARQWSNNLEAKLTVVSVVIVADVVYDNDLTEAFVRTLERIMNVPPKKTVFIALEKSS
ncbi:Uncharacterized protein C16orf68 [Gryllus bimaculatus]|nr:Uncharacterized protein C16orf68 [Gryllus bimaculatus]